MGSTHLVWYFLSVHHGFRTEKHRAHSLALLLILLFLLFLDQYISNRSKMSRRQKHVQAINKIKAAINSFQTKDMAEQPELLKFHKYVEENLEKPTDETQATISL
ncbi:hypothetical protein SLA2020_045890 [Shorea laevis]